MDWNELLANRLVVVSGKGGTGKSTVAAALAMAGARRGRPTLLVEVEGRGEIARTMGVADPGFEERPTPFGPAVLSISPREAVVEYLRLFSGMDRLSRPLVRVGAIDQVVDVAPGFRDLLITGKLYELGHLRRTDPRDRGRQLYELIVVDGPPTGQIAAFLAAAATFSELVRVGPVKRRAASTAEFLRRRARILLVSVPEEMAVAETLEAMPAIAATGVSVAAVTLNRMVPPVFDRDTRRAVQGLTPDRFTELAGGDGLRLEPPDARTLLGEAAALDHRHRHQLGFRDQLARAATVLALPDLPVVEPPEVAQQLASVVAGDVPRRPRPAPPAHRRRRPARPPAVRTSSSLTPHLRDARIVVVCGSGGVGKTSVSAALAIDAAARGTTTALLTVDPARRLASALRLPMVPGEQARVGVGGGRSLDAWQLDTQRTFDELIRRTAGSHERQERILGNPFYRRISDTLAGTQEYMAMEKLFELAAEDRHQLIVIDTPPTRSALSFIEAPNRLTDFLGGRFLRMMLWPTARAGRFTLSAVRFGAGAFFRTAGRLVGAEVLADTIDFLASFEGMYGDFKERPRGCWSCSGRRTARSWSWRHPFRAAWTKPATSSNGWPTAGCAPPRWW